MDIVQANKTIKMKILIVGSKPKLSESDTTVEKKVTETIPDNSEGSAFESACREMGAAFTRDGRTIVVGSVAMHTADRFVLEVTNSVSGNHNVIVIRPDDGRLGPDSKEFANLTFSRRRRGQNWTVARAFLFRRRCCLVK